MSQEGKLKRLGLWHLRNRPEALSKALDRIITGSDMPKTSTSTDTPKKTDT